METLIEKDVRVGQYDPALTSETFQFEDEFSLEAVERMYQQIQEEHDLNLPLGFIEKTDKDPFLVYSDTDSVVGDSNIIINDKEIKICDLWESKGKLINSNKEVKKISQNEVLLTPSVNMMTGKIEYKKIRHIIRHKVKKKLFKITLYPENSAPKEVIITEDHSIICKRDGVFLSIKITEIKENDRLLFIQK